MANTDLSGMKIESSTKRAASKLMGLAEIICLLPMLVFLIYTNYSVDAANVFNDTAEEIGQAIADGNSIYLVDGNVKDKDFKHALIKYMPDKVDCIAVGASLVMGIRRSDVGEDCFYNLGLSGANLYDVMAILGYMKANDKETDRIIICVDSAFFDENIYSANSSPYRVYGEYMIDILNDSSAALPAMNDVYSRLKILEIQQLFSVSYFQANIDHRNEMKERGLDLGYKWGYMGDGVDTAPFYCYYDDGSLLYNYVTRNANENNVINRARNYDMDAVVTRDEHPSEFSKTILVELILYCQREGIELEIFMCPWAPALWDSIPLEHYPILTEGEDYIRQLASEYNVKITGSYNPHIVGVENRQFYDPRHFRHEQLSQFFDFT